MMAYFNNMDNFNVIIRDLYLGMCKYIHGEWIRSDDMHEFTTRYIESEEILYWLNKQGFNYPMTLEQEVAFKLKYYDELTMLEIDAPGG